MPSGSSSEFQILRPGENCWRIEIADRLAPLIDTAAYFEALATVCERAKHSIFILGWDFDRYERLGREDGSPTLEQFIQGLLERRKNLHIYLLIWDYSMIYAAEREWFQSWILRYNSHDRLHVQFDNQHPVGGSQHQKIVVVDDALAFCGGIDLSRWRWDTSQHAASEPRRTDPDGKSYPPFHDLMWLVNGGVASALGELVRTRWKNSGSSEEPIGAEDVQTSDWPDNLKPLFEQIPVAIARTFPSFQRREEVREVEQLFLDSIGKARRYIYVENQYFTSRSLTRVLVDRLKADDAPEVILVLPRHTGGWLEQVTMDALRQGQLHKLQQADHHGRLKVYYPDQPGLPADECISVHAKLMIMDDCFVHSGSANTSDRSMGMDSECDLAWEAPDSDGVSWLLHRLLSEHLGCTIAEVEKARTEQDSLLAGVENLRRPGKRTLSELDTSAADESIDISDEADLVDPTEPINPDYFVHRAVPDEQAPRGRRRLMLFLGFIVLLLLFAAAWRWTPLADWLTPERLAGALEWFQRPLTKFLAVLVVMVIASLLMVPLTLLVIASAVLLGPWLGFGCSMAGALLSAWLGFLFGHLIGGKAVRSLSSSQIHRLSKGLSDRGVMAIAVLRMLPVAPFTVVNLAAGASHLQAGKFMVGSLLGLAPGVAALTVFSGSLFHAVMNPSPKSIGILAAVAVLIVMATLVFRRLLKTS